MLSLYASVNVNQITSFVGQSHSKTQKGALKQDIERYLLDRKI